MEAQWRLSGGIVSYEYQLNNLLNTKFWTAKDDCKIYIKMVQT